MSDAPQVSGRGREGFGSSLGALLAMIGAAVGLGNVWRFPYMTGKFGGAAFVLLYVTIVLVIGIPALMAEWALGRSTRRGTLGAFEAARLPYGKVWGWFLFSVLVVSSGYYAAVVGWVLAFALAELGALLGWRIDSAAILPPSGGFEPVSFGLQALGTLAVLVAGGILLHLGIRRGVERASRVLMPALFLVIIVLVVRALTLPGAEAGLHWYLLRFEPGDITPAVVMAALGHAIFSLALGGMFMVVYGSYLPTDYNLRSGAVATAFGDTLVGLLAGLAIIPAVISLGLEPSLGPGLLFATLPAVFDAIPGGALFGLLFFGGLLGAAYLSSVAGLEVLVTGLDDHGIMPRSRAIPLVLAVVWIISLPPTINERIFVTWDLIFGSGMQTLGALVAAITVGWCLNRASLLEQLNTGSHRKVSSGLIFHIRYGIPAAIALVGVWWLLTSVAGVIQAE